MLVVGILILLAVGVLVVTFGPSGGNMHGDNEYGYEYQVRNCAEICRRTLAALMN